MRARDEGPPWIEDALRQTLAELRAFFATALGFARSPARFADEWYRGARRAMNPVGCLATAAAIAFPLQALLVPADEAHPSLFAQLLGAAGPYLHYAALGALAHPLLRNRRAPRGWSASVGIALYAATLPGLGASLVAAASVALLRATPAAVHRAEEPILAVVIVLAFAVFVAVACRGLAGLHGVSRLRALAALAVAFFATGVFFGYATPPGSYGLHAVVCWRPGKMLDLGLVL